MLLNDAQQEVHIPMYMYLTLPPYRKKRSRYTKTEIIIEQVKREKEKHDEKIMMNWKIWMEACVTCFKVPPQQLTY